MRFKQGEINKKALGKKEMKLFSKLNTKKLFGFKGYHVGIGENEVNSEENLYFLYSNSFFSLFVVLFTINFSFL